VHINVGVGVAVAVFLPKKLQEHVCLATHVRLAKLAEKHPLTKLAEKHPLAKLAEKQSILMADYRCSMSPPWRTSRYDGP